jgi:FtsP/CotA-like multicopper oxidase with cupredoxin domain
MNQGVKEFHLVAEPVIRELAAGMKANLWGYNGQSPGPTIEVVEGDRVRIFVTNRLSEATSIHWHGQRLPNGMDGVSGLTQPAIAAGKTYVYEFIAKRAGTFMYHPHADENRRCHINHDLSPKRKEGKVRVESGLFILAKK